MSYRYEVAPNYSPSKASSTISPASVYSMPGLASERYYLPQGPEIHFSPASSTKEVRFATPDPESPYLYPGERPRTGGSPKSPNGAYLISPTTPSLSYTPNGEEDIQCPPTPLLKPRPLVPENEPSLFSPNSSIYAAYYEIDCVLHGLNALAQYHYPTELDFEPAPLGSYAAPGLSYTAKNRPFLEHNQSLLGLMKKLEGISSRGDENLRRSKRAAGAKVQKAIEELGRVEAMLRRQWDKKHRQL